MKRSADVNVRAVRPPDMVKRRLDRVVRANLQAHVSTNTESTEAPLKPTVSISITVLNPFSDRPEIGAKKFPAAPVGMVHEK